MDEREKQNLEDQKAGTHYLLAEFQRSDADLGHFHSFHPEILQNFWTLHFKI